MITILCLCLVPLLACSRGVLVAGDIEEVDERDGGAEATESSSDPDGRESGETQDVPFDDPSTDEGEDFQSADCELETDAAFDYDPEAATGTCSLPIPVACGQLLEDQTTVGGESTMESYSHLCGEFARYSGPERIYVFIPTARIRANASITLSESWNCGIYILPNFCISSACKMSDMDGDGELSFVAYPCNVYYLVVDGYEGAEGGFSIQVTCGPAEECHNGIDDDGDGATDCCDWECYHAPGCLEVCTNGLDDDCDYNNDCRDWECRDAPSCMEDCTDGIDDNRDGLADCQDPLCMSEAACAEDCGNGADDNTDGLIDCNDPWCASAPACAEDCDNGVDDNHDGVVDCQDPRCVDEAACAEDCDNGEDENANGLIDCAEPSCARDPACFEIDCTDGEDGDGDGLVDCADFDCIADPACRGGPGLPGDPCATHDDCASGACLDEVLSGSMGGDCLGDWSWTQDCATLECPDGTSCVCFRSWGSEPPCGCDRSCDDMHPCDREGYQCLTAGSGADICMGVCTVSEECEATHYCWNDGGWPGLCIMPLEICSGGVDEDGDGATDCDDVDCAFLPGCGAFEASLQGGITCASAAEIDLPPGDRGSVIIMGVLSIADGDDHIPSCQSHDGADVAYKFTLEVRTRITVALWGSMETYDMYDTVLSLSRGCAVPDTLCSDNYGSGLYSLVEGVFEPGNYYVFVDGFDSSGRYWLGLLLSEP